MRSHVSVKKWQMATSACWMRDPRFSHAIPLWPEATIALCSRLCCAPITKVPGMRFQSGKIVLIPNMHCIMIAVWLESWSSRRSEWYLNVRHKDIPMAAASEVIVYTPHCHHHRLMHWKTNVTSRSVVWQNEFLSVKKLIIRTSKFLTFLFSRIQGFQTIVSWTNIVLFFLL